MLALHGFSYTGGDGGAGVGGGGLKSVLLRAAGSRGAVTAALIIDAQIHAETRLTHGEAEQEEHNNDDGGGDGGNQPAAPQAGPPAKKLPMARNLR